MVKLSDVVKFRYEITLDLMLLERDHYTKEWRMLQKSILNDKHVEKLELFEITGQELRTSAEKKFKDEFLERLRDDYEIPVESVEMKYRDDLALNFVLLVTINVDKLIEEYLDFSHVTVLVKTTIQQIANAWKLNDPSEEDVSGLGWQLSIFSIFPNEKGQNLTIPELVKLRSK